MKSACCSSAGSTGSRRSESRREGVSPGRPGYRPGPYRPRRSDRSPGTQLRPRSCDTRRGSRAAGPARGRRRGSGWDRRGCARQAAGSRRWSRAAPRSLRGRARIRGPSHAMRRSLRSVPGRAGGHRMQPDAGSARLQRGPRTLEHVDLAAQIAQHERRGEPPDRSADDPDMRHRVHRRALRTVFRISRVIGRVSPTRTGRFDLMRTRSLSPRARRSGRNTLQS